MKIPVFLPVTREFGFRDEFAQDCLLQRGVRCEPDFRARIPSVTCRIFARHKFLHAIDVEAGGAADPRIS